MNPSSPLPRLLRRQTAARNSPGPTKGRGTHGRFLLTAPHCEGISWDLETPPSATLAEPTHKSPLFKGKQSSTPDSSLRCGLSSISGAARDCSPFPLPPQDDSATRPHFTGSPQRRRVGWGPTLHCCLRRRRRGRKGPPLTCSMT